MPNLAKREHLKNLPLLFRNLKLKIGNSRAIDLLAVTIGPGLEPCLWSGIEFTKKIYQQLKAKNSKLKLIGVNHLEGHLYSFLLTNKLTKLKTKSLFPAVALIVSGGHTILILMKSLTQWKKLGETRDDAVGEAFDKVGRLLKLPFPGGPEIERLANRAKELKTNKTIAFPRPMINQKNYDFSFSGLKTSVLYYLRDNPLKTKSYKLKANIAASFQQAAIDVLVAKTIRAAKEFEVKSIMLSGGVAANKLLRKTLKAESQKLKAKFFAPPAQFNTDNAAMIAVAAYIAHLRKTNRKISAWPNLNL